MAAERQKRRHQLLREVYVKDHLLQTVFGKKSSTQPTRAQYRKCTATKSTKCWSDFSVQKASDLVYRLGNMVLLEKVSMAA